MNKFTLLITLSYFLNSKGEKNSWFKVHLYRNQRDNQWRCLQKDCNGRIKTFKNLKGEEEKSEERLPHNCSAITYEEFMCKKALNRMKERIKDEIHTAPSDIYTQEIDKLVELREVPRAIVGLYIKSYQHYTSTFIISRQGLKPVIPHDLDDLNFEGENAKCTQTTDKKP